MTTITDIDTAMAAVREANSLLELKAALEAWEDVCARNGTLDSQEREDVWNEAWGTSYLWHETHNLSGGDGGEIPVAWDDTHIMYAELENAEGKRGLTIVPMSAGEE